MKLKPLNILLWSILGFAALLPLYRNFSGFGKLNFTIRSFRLGKLSLSGLPVHVKDLDALRQLIALIGQNITKIEDIASQKLDVNAFRQWEETDFLSVINDLETHTHSEFSDNHTHENAGILSQISAAFTASLQQKLSGIEERANRYIHPEKPVSGNAETIAKSIPSKNAKFSTSNVKIFRLKTSKFSPQTLNFQKIDSKLHLPLLYVKNFSYLCIWIYYPNNVKYLYYICRRIAV